jgi:hypothetical protein
LSDCFYNALSNMLQAYATDLVKDGAVAFTVKISGHKHTFEAQTAAEREGWFIAVEKAITEAKAEKEGIESSEGYKEHKEKISMLSHHVQDASHRVVTSGRSR